MMFIIVVLMIFWFSLINYFVYVKKKIIKRFCYVFFIRLNIILVCYGINKYFVERVLECKIGS